MIMAAAQPTTMSVVKRMNTSSDPMSKSRKDNSSKKRKATVRTDSTTTIPDPTTLEQATPSTEVSAETKMTLEAEGEGRALNSKKRKLSVEEIEVDITAPEPPSKKALRLLKKGKPLPPSRSGAESSPEPQSKNKKAEVEKRSEHGIWIGNLPWHISKLDLRNFLTSNSDLTEDTITRIHMPSPNDSKPANKVEDQKKFIKPQHNKGFAYVDLSTAEAVEQAVELSEQLLSGRRVLIKNNKSFEGRPDKPKEDPGKKDGKPASKRVFLGNLSFDATEDSLKEHFEKCGPIAMVKVATFEDTGKCKGYAWITFEELAGAESAVRGYVMIEEPLSDDDSSSSSSEDEGSHEQDEPASDPETSTEAKANTKQNHKVRPPKTKKRKWWVNKIKGRPLRMEFAEDAQVRYKKRYGKDGTKTSSPAAAAATTTATTSAADGAGTGDAAGTTMIAAPPPNGERAGKKREGKKTEYMLPYGGPRLTGGIVESKGTKVTF